VILAGLAEGGCDGGLQLHEGEWPATVITIYDWVPFWGWQTEARRGWRSSAHVT